MCVWKASWVAASYSIGLDFLNKALYKRSYSIFSFVWRRILMEDWVTLFDLFRANCTMNDWLWELWHLISKDLADWSKFWQILLIYLYHISNIFTIYSVLFVVWLSLSYLYSINCSQYKMVNRNKFIHS